MEDHRVAIKLVLNALVDKDYGVIKDMSEISAVGHRVVHGGEKYGNSVLIDGNVMKAIEDCAKLAPLHNPPNLIGINACKALMKDTPMVAVFDTAFHQTILTMHTLMQYHMNFMKNMELENMVSMELHIDLFL